MACSRKPDGNNGKVYATGTEWRLYQTNSAVVTVAATEATIKSVAFEFTVKNTGVIKYDGNAMTSGTAVNVNAASAQFVVGNFYDATNGQVIISGFTVVYETTGGASGYTVSLNDGTENPTTWTASTDGTNFGALPIGGLKGDGSETVTLKYNGRLKVKSVTATTDAGAPAAAMPMLTLGSMPNGGDPFSGSSGSGAYSQTFAVGGQIAIIYKNTSNESVKVVTDALTAADISNEGKTATINVSIDDADKTQGVTYIYPAAMANDEGTINYDFKNQDGTVTAIYSGSGAWDGDALSSATMESQQAIVKFNLKDEAGTFDLSASSLNISAASNKLVKYKSYRGAGSKTYYYGDSYYTVDGGSGGFNEDEEHKSLVDNKLDTKWCQNKPGGNWYIEFHTASAIQVDGYMLRTGGDTGSETGRNPQSWVLYGKKNSGESWSIIDSKTDNYDMPNASNAEKDFDADAPGQYQYFRLEISAIRGGSCMQMSEMRLFSYEYYELGTTYGDLTVTPASATSEMTVALRNENASDDTYTLTATVGGATYNYTKSGVTFENGKYYVITVKMNPKKVSSISLNKTSANLAIGGTVELSANASPSDAVDKTVTWSSDKTSVATVNATTGVVTAVAEGTATITATANDGSGTKATCSVMVYPEGTIVWDSSNISKLSVSGTYASYTKEGITLSANADMIDAFWSGSGDYSGIYFNAHASGGFTFKAPTGKKFTKIEMKAQGSGGWDMANLGTGWAINIDFNTNNATVTWTGSATSTVDLLKDTNDFTGANVKSIVFYLSE